MIDLEEGDYVEQARITISLCMIVRDEEETIARCLDTVEKLWMKL